MSSILRFKDSDGNWVDVPALRGKQGPVGPTGPTGPMGDMDPAVYDPQGKRTDIFAYIDAAAAAVQTRLSRFVVNDDSIAPTGTYSDSYDTSYGVQVGYCPDGSVLLSMKAAGTTSYENLWFSLASAPDGVTIQTNNNTYDTSGDTGNLFVCRISGVTGKVSIAIAMDTRNGTYDYVECAVTVTPA